MPCTNTSTNTLHKGCKPIPNALPQLAQVMEDFTRVLHLRGNLLQAVGEFAPVRAFHPAVRLALPCTLWLPPLFLAVKYVLARVRTRTVVQSSHDKGKIGSRDAGTRVAVQHMTGILHQRDASFRGALTSRSI